MPCKKQVLNDLRYDVEQNLIACGKIKLYYNGSFDGELPGEYSVSPASVNIDAYPITGTGDKYKVRVESVSDASVYDESDNYFTITSTTKILL